MENILVSACLLGEQCRYNGTNCYSEKIENLKEKYNLVSICPEILAGLSTPRNSAELRDDIVIDSDGNDLTQQFIDGANKCLKIARETNCKIAILKSKSPSCGLNKIYDGSFTNKLINGNGITAKLLAANGIKIFTEDEINLLLDE